MSKAKTKVDLVKKGFDDKTAKQRKNTAIEDQVKYILTEFKDNNFSRDQLATILYEEGDLEKSKKIRSKRAWVTDAGYYLSKLNFKLGKKVDEEETPKRFFTEAYLGIAGKLFPSFFPEERKKAIRKKVNNKMENGPNVKARRKLREDSRRAGILRNQHRLAKSPLWKKITDRMKAKLEDDVYDKTVITEDRVIAFKNVADLLTAAKMNKAKDQNELTAKEEDKQNFITQYLKLMDPENNQVYKDKNKRDVQKQLQQKTLSELNKILEKLLTESVPKEEANDENLLAFFNDQIESINKNWSTNFADAKEFFEELSLETFDSILARPSVNVPKEDMKKEEKNKGEFEEEKIILEDVNEKQNPITKRNLFKYAKAFFDIAKKKGNAASLLQDIGKDLQLSDNMDGYQLYLVSTFDSKECEKIKGNAVVLDNTNTARFIVNGKLLVDSENPKTITNLNRQGIDYAKSKTPAKAKAEQSIINNIIQQAASKAECAHSGHITHIEKLLKNGYYSVNKLMEIFLIEDIQLRNAVLSQQYYVHNKETPEFKNKIVWAACNYYKNVDGNIDEIKNTPSDVLVFNKGKSFLEIIRTVLLNIRKNNGEVDKLLTKLEQLFGDGYDRLTFDNVKSFLADAEKLLENDQVKIAFRSKENAKTLDQLNLLFGETNQIFTLAKKIHDDSDLLSNINPKTFAKQLKQKLAILQIEELLDLDIEKNFSLHDVIARRGATATFIANSEKGRDTNSDMSDSPKIEEEEEEEEEKELRLRKERQAQLKLKQEQRQNQIVDIVEQLTWEDEDGDIEEQKGGFRDELLRYILARSNKNKRLEDVLIQKLLLEKDGEQAKADKNLTNRGRLLLAKAMQLKTDGQNDLNEKEDDNKENKKNSAVPDKGCYLSIIDKKPDFEDSSIKQTYRDCYVWVREEIKKEEIESIISFEVEGDDENKSEHENLKQSRLFYNGRPVALLDEELFIKKILPKDEQPKPLIDENQNNDKQLLLENEDKLTKPEKKIHLSKKQIIENITNNSEDNHIPDTVKSRFGQFYFNHLYDAAKEQLFKKEYKHTVLDTLKEIEELREQKKYGGDLDDNKKGIQSFKDACIDQGLTAELKLERIKNSIHYVNNMEAVLIFKRGHYFNLKSAYKPTKIYLEVNKKEVVNGNKATCTFTLAGYDLKKPELPENEEKLYIECEVYLNEPDNLAEFGFNHFIPSPFSYKKNKHKDEKKQKEYEKQQLDKQKSSIRRDVEKKLIKDKKVRKSTQKIRGDSQFVSFLKFIKFHFHPGDNIVEQKYANTLAMLQDAYDLLMDGNLDTDAKIKALRKFMDLVHILFADFQNEIEKSKENAALNADENDARDDAIFEDIKRREGILTEFKKKINGTMANLGFRRQIFNAKKTSTAKNSDGDFKGSAKYEVLPVLSEADEERYFNELQQSIKDQRRARKNTIFFAAIITTFLVALNEAVIPAFFAIAAHHTIAMIISIALGAFAVNLFLLFPAAIFALSDLFLPSLEEKDETPYTKWKNRILKGVVLGIAIAGGFIFATMGFTGGISALTTLLHLSFFVALPVPLLFATAAFLAMAYLFFMTMRQFIIKKQWNDVKKWFVNLFTQRKGELTRTFVLRCIFNVLYYLTIGGILAGLCGVVAFGTGNARMVNLFHKIIGMGARVSQILAGTFTGVAMVGIGAFYAKNIIKHMVHIVNVIVNPIKAWRYKRNAMNFEKEFWKELLKGHLKENKKDTNGWFTEKELYKIIEDTHNQVFKAQRFSYHGAKTAAQVLAVVPLLVGVIFNSLGVKDSATLQSNTPGTICPHGLLGNHHFLNLIACFAMGYGSFSANALAIEESLIADKIKNFFDFISGERSISVVKQDHKDDLLPTSNEIRFVYVPVNPEKPAEGGTWYLQGVIPALGNKAVDLIVGHVTADTLKFVVNEDWKGKTGERYSVDVSALPSGQTDDFRGMYSKFLEQIPPEFYNGTDIAKSDQLDGNVKLRCDEFKELLKSEQVRGQLAKLNRSSSKNNKGEEIALSKNSENDRRNQLYTPVESNFLSTVAGIHKQLRQKKQENANDVNKEEVEMEPMKNDSPKEKVKTTVTQFQVVDGGNGNGTYKDKFFANNSVKEKPKKPLGDNVAYGEERLKENDGDNELVPLENK